MRVACWADRLAELLTQAEGRRFAWGRWDCCQFAARAVAAITARDPRAVFPRYRNKREAEAVIAECGGMEALVRRALGEPMQNKAYAQRGDVVLCDFGRGLQPGVCMGMWSLAPGRRGLERRLTGDAVMAWKV